MTFRDKNHISAATKISLFHFFIMLFIIPLSAYADADKEYEVKTAFIIKMVSFITWPEGTQAVINSEKLNFCIADNNQTIIKTRELLLANGALQKYFNIQSSQNLSKCNVLFISKMSNQEYSALLNNIEAQGPILTFSDTPGYAQTGVMVNFYTEQQKIGFEINWNKMKAKGFEISSRVLKLARIVDGD